MTNRSDNKIILGITMGDPAGVGPEIILKALSQPNKLAEDCVAVVIGSVEVLRFFAERLNINVDLKTITDKDLSSLNSSPGCIWVLEPQVILLPPVETILGQVTAEAGLASFRYITTAIRLVTTDLIDAIVTAPISKAAWHKADINFPGHTEMLAHYSDTKDFAMMLVGGGIRVVLATIHLPLAQVPRAISPQKLSRLIHLVNKFMPYFGLEMPPRIAVCGLNPHAGEDSLLGSEEQELIIPVIKKAREEGVNVFGPYPADTIYYRMLQGEFDVIIAMYHDQGLIPIKTLDFHGGVNITIGLPFIRTSVDHGTAFDIAGKGIARPDSLLSAIRLAGELTRNKHKLSNTTTPDE